MTNTSNLFMCQDVLVADHRPAADWLLQWAPNHWWRHQCIWPTEREEPEWVSLEEHWTAWSTISEVGPIRGDPTESGLLADPDWATSELRGKVEEVNIWDDLRAPDLTLTPTSEVKESPKLSHNSPGGTNEQYWLLSELNCWREHKCLSNLQRSQICGCFHVKLLLS